MTTENTENTEGTASERTGPATKGRLSVTSVPSVVPFFPLRSEGFALSDQHWAKPQCRSLSHSGLKSQAILNHGEHGEHGVGLPRFDGQSHYAANLLLSSLMNFNSNSMGRV